MPRLIITEGGARGLEHCRTFLADKDPWAAQRAAGTIAHHLTLLETQPGLGRPLPDYPELRELAIPFGESGYVALYHHDPSRDQVLILAFRHSGIRKKLATIECRHPVTHPE